MRLGVDAKKSDQQVRGSHRAAGHGTGKTCAWRCSPRGRQADEARPPAPTSSAWTTLAEKMTAGDLNYDVVIATPDAMRVVGKLGQVLGPCAA